MGSQAHKITRRTLLTGAGVTMALPWLESLPTFGFLEAAETPVTTPPKLLCRPLHGQRHQPQLLVGASGAADMELSKTLEPINSLKSRLNVITGLFNKHATGVGIHPGQTGNILSGAALRKGAVLHGGTSMDQLLAARFADETAQPSLVLG